MLDNVSFPSRRSRRDVHHRRQFGQPGEPIFPGGGDGPKGGNPQAAPAQADTSTTPAPVQPPTSSPQTSTTPSSTSTASSTTPSSTSASPTQPSTSSTASSASSTTGTSTPSSAPASTPPAPLSTSTPLAVVPSKPVANPTVNVVYETSTLGNAASAASASSSSTPAPQGGVSTGIIVGGVAAGAVAVIGILIGIVYFVRKRKSDEDDVLGSWNPDDVRRQSQMIHDSDPIMPSSGMGGMGMGMNGGYGSAGARPPTMIERHVNNASPMLARQRSMGAQYAPQQPSMPAFDHNGYPIESGYGAGGYGGQQQRYADYPQDDFMRNMPPAGNPFMSPYEQPMASPVSSTVPIYDSRVAEPSAAVTRQPSVTQQQGGPVRKPSLLSSPQEADAYADLDRSSVTPFQAQQYAEIQSKLHGGPQAGALGAVEEEQHQQQYHQQQQQGGPTPPPAAVTPGRVSPTHSAPNQPIARSAPQAQGQDAAKRPDTMYSAIYDEEDVYGGI